MHLCAAHFWYLVFVRILDSRLEQCKYFYGKVPFNFYWVHKQKHIHFNCQLVTHSNRISLYVGCLFWPRPPRSLPFAVSDKTTHNMLVNNQGNSPKNSNYTSTLPGSHSENKFITKMLGRVDDRVLCKSVAPKISLCVNCHVEVGNGFPQNWVSLVLLI